MILKRLWLLPYHSREFFVWEFSSDLPTVRVIEPNSRSIRSDDVKTQSTTKWKFCTPSGFGTPSGEWS